MSESILQQTSADETQSNSTGVTVLGPYSQSPRDELKAMHLQMNYLKRQVAQLIFLPGPRPQATLAAWGRGRLSIPQPEHTL